VILNSFPFLVFFTVVFFIYWKISPKYQWLVLLLSGYFFYSTALPAYLILIILSTVVNYFASLAIASSTHHKKKYLLLAIIFNLSALFIFKYFNFFTSTLNPDWKFLDWALPLGISFYTLQIVGYLLDIYSDKIKPEKKLRFFALFHCFFPQLSAGPIERGHTLLPQLKKQKVFNYAKVSSGIKLFTYGLFKKLVIADNLGIIVDRVFGSLPDYKGLSLIIVTIFYTWQIYMDFSGYTDMARGIARTLGIDLLENFNLPYFATSVRDFWRRWHISFSSWLRDYVYIPLGGSRVRLPRIILNTLIVFAVSGLWHGAAWTFVIWGILHGVAITLERITKYLLRRDFLIPKFIKIFYAYILISIFWIFFRAQSLSDALYIIRNSFVGLKNIFLPDYIWATLNQVFIFNQAEMAITFIIFFIAVSAEFIRTNSSLYQILNRQPVLVRYAFYIIVVFIILQFRVSDIKEFIYTKF